MDEKRLPFLGHLMELQRRIIYIAISLVVAMAGCFFFAEHIFNFLAQPLVHAMQHQPRLHIQSPMEVFFVHLKLAVIAGLVVAAPFVFLQLWLFVAPGLYKRERRVTISFVFFASAFFFGGIAFAYYVVFPFGFEYLLSFAYDRQDFSVLEGIARSLDHAGIAAVEVNFRTARFVSATIEPTIMMEKYISLVVKLLLAFGLIFELPLVFYFLAKIGMVTHRSLWRFFRYWIVISFLLAAILTPPDVVTQAMMAGPLIVMYLGSIVVAWFITRRRERREARMQGYDEQADDDEENG